MKKHLIFCFFLSLIVIPITIKAQNIPTSSRSREAISKVAPKIRLELSKVVLDRDTPIFIRIFKEELLKQHFL